VKYLEMSEGMVARAWSWFHQYAAAAAAAAAAADLHGSLICWGNALPFPQTQAV